MELTDHILPVIALVLGYVVHILKKVIQQRQRNETFSLKDYINKWPYQTIVSLIMSLGGYLGLMAVGDLTAASAFLMGVTANSLAGAAPGDRP